MRWKNIIIVTIYTDLPYHISQHFNNVVANDGFLLPLTWGIRNAKNSQNYSHKITCKFETALKNSFLTIPLSYWCCSSFSRCPQNACIPHALQVLGTGNPQTVCDSWDSSCRPCRLSSLPHLPYRYGTCLLTYRWRGRNITNLRKSIISLLYNSENAKFALQYQRFSDITYST